MAKPSKYESRCMRIRDAAVEQLKTERVRSRKARARVLRTAVLLIMREAAEIDPMPPLRDGDTLMDSELLLAFMALEKLRALGTQPVSQTLH